MTRQETFEGATCRKCGGSTRFANGSKKCVSCAKVARDRSRATPGQERDRYLMRRYGITAEEFDQKLRSQGGGCAICGGTKTYRAMAVDHDHKTGRIRDILCMFCNTALGKMQDSPVLLRAAADYLERHAKRALS